MRTVIILFLLFWAVANEVLLQRSHGREKELHELLKRSRVRYDEIDDDDGGMS